MNQQSTARRTEEQVTEIDLWELFGHYLSHLPLLIAAIVTGSLIAGLITTFLITDKYTATSQIYMVSASSDSVVNLQDLNLGTSLSSDYVELMKSRPIVEEVAEKLDLDLTYADMLQMISLSVVNNTRIIKIAVTSTDPQTAMDIANQMVRTTRVRLPKLMDTPSPSIVEEAVLPQYPSAPSLKKNVMIGAMLLLAAVLAVLTIQFLLDDTIKTAEDLEREFGVLPLSVIPEGEIAGLKREEEPRAGRNRRKQYRQKKGAKA